MVPQVRCAALNCPCKRPPKGVLRHTRADAALAFAISLMSRCYNTCFAGVIILVFLITKVAHALNVGSYRRLDLNARLALVNRALFGLVYSVSFAPYTVSAYFIFFSPTTGDDQSASHVQDQLKAWALRLLSCLLGVQLSMHVYEVGASSRRCEQH